MSEPVVVRPARPAEYPAVGRLTIEVYVGGGLVKPTSDYVAILGDAADRGGKSDLLVATLRGKLVGTVAYCPPDSPYAQFTGPDEAEFRMLAVAPGARGKGVGAALVQACLDRARAAGMAVLRLTTQVNMRDAQRMYERLGFVRTPEHDWTLANGLSLITYARTLDSE